MSTAERLRAMLLTRSSISFHETSFEDSDLREAIDAARSAAGGSDGDE